VSRAYTGVDDNDHTVPGVVIVRSDGKIVYRQVASTKDDRIPAPEILATADRVLGTSGSRPKPATPAIDRLQLRLDAGVTRVGGSVGFIFGPGVYLPIARYFIAGLEARHADSGDLYLRQLAGGVAGVRLPIYGDIAALQVLGMFGWAGLAEDGFYAGGRAGVWFAWTPTWALQLEAGMLAKPAADVTVTFGVTRLFGR
jgi:hypothetical protein